MKLAQTPTLVIRPHAGFEGLLSTRAGNWELCLDQVKEWFDIPDDARYAQFTAYNRPSKDRLHICIEPEDRCQNAPCDSPRLRWSKLFEITIDGSESEEIYVLTYREIQKKMGDVTEFYVELETWS